MWVGLVLGLAPILVDLMAPPLKSILGPVAREWVRRRGTHVPLRSVSDSPAIVPIQLYW